MISIKLWSQRQLCCVNGAQASCVWRQIRHMVNAQWRNFVVGARRQDNVCPHQPAICTGFLSHNLVGWSVIINCSLSSQFNHHKFGTITLIQKMSPGHWRPWLGWRPEPAHLFASRSYATDNAAWIWTYRCLLMISNFCRHRSLLSCQWPRCLASRIREEQPERFDKLSPTGWHRYRSFTRFPPVILKQIAVRGAAHPLVLSIDVRTLWRVAISTRTVPILLEEPGPINQPYAADVGLSWA